MAAKRVEQRLKAVQAESEPGALVAALQDPSPLVVDAAATRLGRLAERGGFTYTEARPLGLALLSAYRRLDAAAPGSDPGCRARLAVLTALSRLEVPEAEEAALRAVRTVQVETVGFGLEDTGVSLRSTAAGVLASLRAPGALTELGLLLFDFEPNVACAAAHRPYAKAGADPYLTATAATGIATLVREQAVPLLEDALETAAPEGQASIVYAIASVRADAARQALLRLRSHPVERVRRVALELTESW